MSEDNLLDFCEFKRKKAAAIEQELRRRALRSALSLSDKYFKEVTGEDPKDIA